jgi:hypothetical protein
MPKKEINFWEELKKVKNKGLALAVEVIMFTGFLALLVGAFLWFWKSYQRQKNIIELRKEVSVIFDFVRNLYTSNLQVIRSGACEGYRNCDYTLTPEPVDDHTFRVHIFDLSLLNKLQGYCQANQVGNSDFDIVCYSPVSGQPLKIDMQAYQEYHKPYYAPYQGQYFSMTIEEPVLGNKFTLVLDTEINKSLIDTGNILETLKQAFQEWAKKRYDLALGNDCGDNNNPPTDPVGGLGSWDDELIPWIWQLFGNAPCQITSRGRMPILCQGIDNGCQCGSDCGCTNFQDNENVWKTTNEYCMFNDPNLWDTILGRLNLSSSYKMDGFGNLITFVPISDAGGNPIDCPPPPPQCCYRYDIPKKGSLGIYDWDNRQWLYRIEVVYPY